MTIFEILMYSAFCIALIVEDIRLLTKEKDVSNVQILTYLGLFVGFVVGSVGKVITNADWTTLFFLLGFALSGIALEFAFYIRRNEENE